MPPRAIILLLAALFCLTSNAVNDKPVTRAEACRVIDNRGSDPLCGLWRMGTDGATVAILPVNASRGRFDIFLIDSPDLSAIPGRLIGNAVSTGSAATYDAEFAGAGKFHNRRQRFIITLGDDGHLHFKPYKKGKKISLWRWLPYLYRFTITDIDTRPTNADGAVRVYPPVTNSEPIVL